MNATTRRITNLTVVAMAISALAMSLGASQIPPQTPPTAATPAVAPEPAVEPVPAPVQAAPAAPSAPPAPAAPRASTNFYYAFGSGPYLGVDLRDVTSERLAPLKLKEERGAEVTMVDQDSPAGKAGIKEQDVILTFNGNNVESVEQLRRMIHELPPGRTVTLGLSREGRPVTVTAQLADRKELSRKLSAGTTRRIIIPPIPPIEIDPPDFGEGFPFTVSVRTARIGVVAEALTPQLGEFFGVPNGHGLLVKSVEKGSIAEAAGVKAGDVIVKVGTSRISDSGDWRMAMREHSGATPLTVVRDKREQTLTVKLPERNKQTGEYSVEILGADWDRIALNLGPQIEAATRVGMESAARAMDQASREVERALRENKLQIEREKTQLKREVERQKTEIKREVERQKREVEREKVRMKREVKVRVNEEIL
jgi:serine protease Do